MKILVTGAAGFIGFHLCQQLCHRGNEVIGIDNLNNYYDVRLKHARLKQLEAFPNFHFIKLDLADATGIATLFDQHAFTHVVNLAAQAGVRYSIENPMAYIQSNIVGFTNILEGCRHHHIHHLVYASSSSVYGSNTHYPFQESNSVDHPVALYAASKKSNELLAHSYAHLYRLPCTGLRFFTVYGPWGRPDMALFKFAKNILAGEPIDVYNHGNMQRDFTYIDDIVEGILRALDNPAQPDPNWSGTAPNPASSQAPWRVYNIGNGNPIKLTDFIACIEKQLGKKAIFNLMPLQPGDVPATYADTQALQHDLGYTPTTTIDNGIKQFIDWYQSYYPATTSV